MDIITQLIGGFGIIASIVAFQCKKHGSILIFRTLNEGLFTVQYFLLSAWTGAAASVIGIARNLIFKKQVEKNQSTTALIILFSILFTVFGIIFWEGPKSILIIVAKVLSTVAYGNKNTTVVRIIILITSTSWLIYNYFVFSIAGVLCEAFTLTSLIVGIIRLDLVPRLKAKREK